MDSLLDKWFLKGHHQPSPCQRSAPFLPAFHEVLTKTWRAPYSACVNPSTAAALTTVDGAEEKGYSKLSPLEEAVSTRGLKSVAHLSRPCRMTSALANKVYAAAGQAGSALHMSVLQVFQAKLLSDMDESGRDQHSHMLVPRLHTVRCHS